MSRSKNASPNESGNYFGAMPYLTRISLPSAWNRRYGKGALVSCTLLRMATLPLKQRSHSSSLLRGS
jgi:hypothetical protein